MTTFGWSTCPDEIKTQITSLENSLLNILGENLTGIYLHGSLAMNCFNPRRSDIDLLVVVNSPLAVQTKRNLSLSLIKTSRNPAPVEVNSLARSVFDPWQYPTPFEFFYNENLRQAVQQSILDGGSAEPGGTNRSVDLAAHIALARRRGVSLFGPEPAEIFPIVPEEDYVDSLLQTIYNEKIGLTVNTLKPVDAILLACNAYAHTRTDAIYSKAEAGQWALYELPSRYHPLIQAALNSYRGEADDRTFPREGLPEFIKFMKADFERFSALPR
jgi:predicted nucleotidyltransferase